MSLLRLETQEGWSLDLASKFHLIKASGSVTQAGRTSSPPNVAIPIILDHWVCWVGTDGSWSSTTFGDYQVLHPCSNVTTIWNLEAGSVPRRRDGRQFQESVVSSEF